MTPDEPREPWKAAGYREDLFDDADNERDERP